MMRTNVVIFFVLALFFVALPVFGHQPQVVSRSGEINFGELRMGSSRDSLYLFSVDGPPVVVTGVLVDCVCTKVKWDRRPVASGSQGSILITYKAKEPGLFYKTIYVTLSDPKRSFKIVVRGRVVV